MKSAKTITLAAALALASSAAWAVPTQVSTGDVDIQFDTDSSYYASTALVYSGIYNEYYQMPSWSTEGNALVLQPPLYLDVGGSGYADTGYINFSLSGISFAAHTGYQITGYQISFTGAQGTVGDGNIQIEGSEGYLLPGAGLYTFTTGVIGSLPDAFSAHFTLDAPYVEGPDGTALVYGTAYASIDSIRIEAMTAPVPEPETWALFGSGLLAMGLLRRRSRL